MPAVGPGTRYLLAQPLHDRTAADRLDDLRRTAFEADVFLRQTVGLKRPLDSQQQLGE